MPAGRLKSFKQSSVKLWPHGDGYVEKRKSAKKLLACASRIFVPQRSAGRVA